MRRLARLWILCAVILSGSSLTAQQNELRFNRLIVQLQQGSPALGLNIGIRSVETGRLLRRSGLDFIVIDMEHQVYDFTAMRDVILGLYEQPFSPEVMSAAAEMVPTSTSPPFFPPPPPPTVLVKIARRGHDQIQFDVRHALKMGAMGVFVPFTESPADIEAAVEGATNAESSYVLRGARQEWAERNNPWPLNPKGEFLVGAMIESLEGEAHIDEILSTPGLAMVWLAHTSTEAVANEIVKKCVERGIFVASPHVDPTSFKADMDAGYRMFFFGWDRDMFYRGLGDVMRTAKEAIGQR